MKKLIYLFVLVILAGCATTPSVYISDFGTKNLTAENINKIQKGKTTQAEILALFGEPMMKTQSTTIGSIWTYTHSVSKTTDYRGFPIRMPETESRSYTLSVRFDGNNMVSDYTFFEANPLMQGSFTQVQ